MHPLSVGKGCTGRSSHVAQHGTGSCVSCQLSVVHMPGGMASNNCNLHTFQESVCTGEYIVHRPVPSLKRPGRLAPMTELRVYHKWCL